MHTHPATSIASSHNLSLQKGWKWTSVTQLHLVSGKQITPPNPPLSFWVRCLWFSILSCLAPMGKLKPVSFLCGGAHPVALGPWISLKYFQGDKAKVAHMGWLWTWACSACWDIFQWKIYQGQQQKATVQRPKEEVFLKVLRNSPKCGLQEENTFGISRKKCPTIFFFLVNIPKQGWPVVSRTQRNCRIRSLLQALLSPKMSFLKLLVVPLRGFPGSQVISLWQTLTELLENVQELSCQSHFCSLTYFNCVSSRRDKLGKRNPWHSPVSSPV